MNKFLAGTAMATVLLVTSHAARADYIVNGGFETGDFTGWTLTFDPSVTDTATFVTSAGFGFPGAPHSGSFYAALGAVGGDAHLSQTFTDPVGQPLVISYWRSSDGATPNDFSVDFNGTQLIAETDIPQQDYTEFTFDVTATGDDTLTINARNDPNYLSLDDVSVDNAGAAVPEPASLGLFSAGLALFGLRRRRRKPA
jgi:hypothetical protein